MGGLAEADDTVGGPHEGPPDVSVVIADVAEPRNIAAALDQAGLSGLIAAADVDRRSVVVLVDMAGFSAGDPAQLEAAAVEQFVDLLFEAGAASVVVASSADSSSLWAGNRDVYARAELAGYRYVTDGDNPYDIIDLGDETRAGVFPEGSVLFGTPASQAWLDGDLRIVLAALRCDPADGFSGGLRTLLSALPLADKTLEYCQRRDAGEVISAVLSAMPPHFTILDGRRIARGLDGDQSHSEMDAGVVIASRSILLADIAAGLKLGLDPYTSNLVRRVSQAHPLPAAQRFFGDLSALEGVPVAAPIQVRAARARQASRTIGDLIEPWRQEHDPVLFPLKRPLDARAHAAITGLVGDDVAGGWKLALDLMAGAAADVVRSWQFLFDKNTLVRRAVSLGFDPGAVPASAYDDMVEELDSLVPIVSSAPERADGLRWRKINGEIVFSYIRDLAIPFDRFVAAVDVGRAIQFMSDYIGGVIVPVEGDPAGPLARQAERNLYLPQPNYLVLYGGQPIDVSKIEVVRRLEGSHQLYWKTILSANDSATADDGVITFQRTGAGTRVSIVGKQAFTLPPFWKLFDISLVPDLEINLTNHAYTTFFGRTLANFEALVEGRDVAIGVGPDTPVLAPATSIEHAVRRVVDVAEPWLTALRPPPRAQADERGFVHVAPEE